MRVEVAVMLAVALPAVVVGAVRNRGSDTGRSDVQLSVSNRSAAGTQIVDGCVSIRFRLRVSRASDMAGFSITCQDR